MGRAIAHVLRAKAGLALAFWDKDEAKFPRQQALADVVRGADVVFVCVPSYAIRSVAEEIRPHLRSNTVVATVAKGLESKTRLTVDGILRDCLPATQPIALLAGPMLADEMTRDLPSAGVVGTTARHAFARLANVFAGTTLHLQPRRDIFGVALCGVLKNIYAVGVGVGEGVGFGDNWRGWFISRAVVEMACVLKRLGGKPTTAYSPAGLGDLIATGMSSHSSNRAVGWEYGRHGQTGRASEGLTALPSMAS
jgi:glycerol-3-phosphate dehydrogenase (NAD(P)+)